MAGETSDNIDELDVLLYDGTRLTVGATTDDDLERIISAGGRRGEIYRRLKELRDRYADRIRKEFPMIPRRVSGFNLPALIAQLINFTLLLIVFRVLVYRPLLNMLDQRKKAAKG